MSDFGSPPASITGTCDRCRHQAMRNDQVLLVQK